MLTPTPAGAVWPARLAYVAAGLFTAASGGTNLSYGWHKGTDLSGSLVWAAVSIGVSIVFSLSWPALIRNIDARQWSRAAVALVALLITGAYSISAALGSAMGGRTNAAASESAISDARTHAQTTYEGARAELSALKPSRPVAELEALLPPPSPRAASSRNSAKGRLFAPHPRRWSRSLAGPSDGRSLKRRWRRPTRS